MTPREARQAAGLSLSMMARALGVTPTFISMAERGLSSVSLRFADDFEKVTNVHRLDWPKLSGKAAAQRQVRDLEAQLQALQEDRDIWIEKAGELKDQRDAARALLREHQSRQPKMAPAWVSGQAPEGGA